MKTRPPIYDWDKMFRRKRKFKLYKGKDFDVQPHGMAQMIRNRASIRGRELGVKYKVNIKILDDHLEVFIREVSE